MYDAMMPTLGPGTGIVRLGSTEQQSEDTYIEVLW